MALLTDRIITTSFSLIFISPNCYEYDVGEEETHALV